MRTAIGGGTFRFTVTAFDASDVRKTGLVNGDFTKYADTDGTDDGTTAATMSVTEIANGRYSVAGTAPAVTAGNVKYLHVEVATATYAVRGFGEDFQVYNADGLARAAQALPAVAAAAANGLPILGANTGPMSISGGVTLSNSGGDALALTASGSNGNGLNATANGTGAGVKATGGATGAGIKATGGATSGDGITATAPTSGNGLSANGGGSGNGIDAEGGTTSGTGIWAVANGGNADGAYFNGAGTGHGIEAQSGTGATGDGIRAKAASTNGNGLKGVKSGSGADISGNITGSLSGSVGSVTGDTPQTGDSFALVNGASGVAAIKTDTAAIKAKTDNLPAAPAAVGSAMTLATDALSGASVSSGAGNKIADHVRRRTQANVEASANGDTLGFESEYGAVAKLTHKVAVVGTDLKTYKSDGTTVLGTQAITSTAGADPISGLGDAG